MAEIITITEAQDGARLDRWLKKEYPHLPFGELQKIIRTGQIRVNGKRVKGDKRLEIGQQLRLPPHMNSIVAKKDKSISEEDTKFIQSLVIYKDKHMIAINKPAGLATQGGTKVKKHVDGLLDGLKFDGLRPHIVHRLDKDTSGVLLLARSPKVAKALGDMFRERDIRKYYWAITTGVPQRLQGKITTSIEKEEDEETGRETMKNSKKGKGKEALTYYQVLENAARKLALVAFWPRTGRKHQIRLHALEMGCPLLGDYKYLHEQEILEETPDLPNILHLHSRRIIMRHPITGQKLDITAPLDTQMKKTWDFFGFNSNDDSDPFEELKL